MRLLKQAGQRLGCHQLLSRSQPFLVSVGGMKRTYSSGAPKAITNSIPMHAFLHQLLENGLTCSTAVFPRGKSSPSRPPLTKLSRYGSGTWWEQAVPIFRQVGITIDLVEMSHKRSDFQSTRFKPCNRSTISPLVINRALPGWPHHEGQSLPANRRTQSRTRKNETKLQMND